MGQPYLFSEPLKEGVIVKRPNRFMMDVALNGAVVQCHCPTTGRIGNIDTKGIACLVSEHNDPKRKLKYTVEAISCDELDFPNKNWLESTISYPNWRNYPHRAAA